MVVRYFGGTKLGVGGLINAYRTGAQLALEASKIEERTIDVEFEIEFEYPLMNVVMRLIKDENIQIIDQEMMLKCRYKLAIRKQEAERILILVKNIYGVTLIENDH